MSRAGFVLTGGASSRMGRDKALLDWHGQPMAVHIAEIVRRVTGSVTLVGSVEKYGCLGYPVLADRESGLGPLEGIRTVLIHSPAEWNLIVACDMPYLNPELLERLLLTAEQSGADCIMPAGQPLCAAYSRCCLPVIESRLTQGIRKVTAALEGLRIVSFRAEPLYFQNLNSPADLSMGPAA